MTEVNAKKMQADKQAGEETEVAEDDFFRDDPSGQESLRADKPEDGHVVSGIVERNGGEHQRRANHDQDDKRMAAAFGDGQLGEDEFDRANEQEREKGELMLYGLSHYCTEELKALYAWLGR